jgi:hypothetical protein
MKKLKLMFSNLLEFFKKYKVKKPIQRNSEKSNDDDEFAGTDQVETKDKFMLERKISMPYIINIENTTDNELQDISLFFGNNQTDLDFNSDGNYEKNGIIISSVIPNVTYRYIVKNFITNKTNIGLTYIACENKNQILQNYSVKTQEANGNYFVKVIRPTIDPYQNQTTILSDKEKFTLDGNTEIILHKIKSKTVVKMYFYPEI